jgi:hypothetical protein
VIINEREYNMTLPLSELPTQVQAEIRDELADRAIDLIKNSPHQRMRVADLIKKLATEYFRSEQEVLYVLQYMVHKRKISEQASTITEGKGIQRRRID